MGELTGISALVTGGAHGIGAGIVEVLAREGAALVITDIDEAGAQESAQKVVDSGGRAQALRHDVTDTAACQEVVQTAIDHLGQVDVLVNNAGVSQRIPFGDISEPDWDRMLDINVKSLYRMCQAVLPHMRERGSGRIINTASLVGKAGALPLFTHYVTSKFATVGLTQALAAEVAPDGVLVNGVSPGVVRTPLWEPLLRDNAAEQGISEEEAWKQAVAPIPLGRPQEPQDIGEVVAFLASSRASNITGETINVNGGQLMD